MENYRKQCIMRVFEFVKKFVEPDTEETVLYELRCADCGTTFMTHDPPESAACEDCGGTQLQEESRLYAGGEAPGGA